MPRCDVRKPATSSKTFSSLDEMVPVANRYFGAFQYGKLKLRGIEVRRHDTPLFFKLSDK